MSAFDNCFEIVVGHEGGYVNDPKDPGGETKYGISKRSYPRVNIAALTLDGAKQIYRADYWDKVRGDELDPGLALITFDAAVNNGASQAVRWLQGALNRDPRYGPAHAALADYYERTGAAALAAQHRRLAAEAASTAAKTPS